MTNKQISKILGQNWRGLEPEEKTRFHKLADEAYKRHMQMYPNYYYSPLEARQRKAERKRRYMMKCGRKVNPSSDQQEVDFGEQLIAVQAIQSPEGEAVNNVQLIPVICHHPIQSGNQTLLSFSLAPMDQFYAPFPVPMNLSEEEAAVRHCYGDVGLPPEPPTIYHVSHKDPNLGEIPFSEQLKAIREIEHQSPDVNNNDLSDMYNPFLENNAAEANRQHKGKATQPKVIVKKEPNDDSEPFIFSSAMDVLTSE
ncbi:hypothetical protein B4U80_08349 [Leptotrombidium deliense]|uniref:Sex-determining region Y protein n=1 Tax=Leptotrombidium deliense TaxID=299467 RepID=A0A443SI70_9ACAR|nr:hypothetical protein B4U80_08349 [Leptotrombidium deliense]